MGVKPRELSSESESESDSNAIDYLKKSADDLRRLQMTEDDRGPEMAGLDSLEDTMVDDDLHSETGTAYEHALVDNHLDEVE